MKVSLWRNTSSPARPRTGHSTIRGKTISNPVLIPSLLDDEFPIRNPGTGVATPIGINDGDRQLAPPPPGASALEAGPGQDAGTGNIPQQPEREPPAVPSVPAPPATSGSQSGYHSRGPSVSTVQRRPSTSPPRPTASPTRQQSTPPRAREPSPRSRTNANSMIRYSVVSTGSTAQTGQSGSAPQRKKSTLRSALGKLFGRKKKTGSTGHVALPAVETLGRIRSTSQHRSNSPNVKDPTALNRNLERGTEPKRSASLPITEFDRALRSHSVGPEDISAIESARNSIQADPVGRRRAATTTSRLFQGPRTGEWGGLSPRPASTHARGSRLLTGMDVEDAPTIDDDPNEIGRAITSDMASRRRSRSLSGLEDIENQRGDVRCRSDEIRYWRESYDPGFMSPVSSNGHDGDDAPNVNADVDASTIMPETPATQQRLGANMQPHHEPRTPPQPFSFPGSVGSMQEMAGMKITQAASIETRIQSLESRMHSLERVVNDLCHHTPNFSLPTFDSQHRPATSGGPLGLGIAISDDQPAAMSFTTATTSVPAIPAIYSTADSVSHASFGDAPTFTESVNYSHTTSHPVPTIPSSFLQARPTSNSTVRGSASLPQLHGAERPAEDGDEYQNLLALISAEQSARIALEAKVRTLAHRVEMLSSSAGNTSWARDAMVIQKATPQRVHLPVQQEVPGTAKSLGTFSAFDDDSDEEEGEEEEDGEEEVAGGLERETTAVEITVEDDASYSEPFETPREDFAPSSAYGYGAFGEELRDDGDGRKAARTLSLSQLSMPKHASASGDENIPDVPPTPTGPTIQHGVNF